MVLFVLIFLFILIFQLQTTSSSNSKTISNSDLIASSKTFFIGEGVSENALTGGINKINIRKNRYASLNNNAPIVTLIEPLDNSIDDDGEIEFIFLVQDDSLLRNCILYNNVHGEWMPDEKNKNTFIQPDYPLHFTIKNVSNGNYGWNIICQDDAFNTNSNNNFSFTVNKILPQISIIANQILKEDGILTINLSNYFSDSKGDNLSYSVQSANNLKISIDHETSIATIEPERNLFGERTIVFTAFDEHGSKVDSNPVRISISEEGDTAPRFVSTVTKDGEIDTDGYVFFECNVTDDEGLKEISLYSDTSGTWKLEEIKEVSGLGVFVEFLIKDLPEGDYEWACSATDNSDQETLSDRQYVEVDIDVEIVHDIFNEIVNNIKYPAFVGIEYSKYLNNSIVLGNLVITKENDKEYLIIDIDNQQKTEKGEKIRMYKKIIVSPNEIFNNNFVSGNTATLKLLIDYTYQGKEYREEEELIVSIKGGWII